MTLTNPDLATTRDFVVSINENTLTDLSKTYDVRLSSTVGLGSLLFHACSEKDAVELSDKLTAAINEHAVETAREA